MLESEFGFRFPEPHRDAYNDFQVIASTDNFAAAFPNNTLLKTKDAIQRAYVNHCAKWIVPVMMADRGNIPDYYGFDTSIRKANGDYGIIVFAYRDNVKGWAHFTSFVRWLRTHCNLA